MPYKNKIQQKAAQAAHYQRNKYAYYASHKRLREERYLWILMIKSSQKCKYCSEDNPVCLAYHHRDPATKYKSIAYLVDKVYSEEVILEEIAKCDIVCHNCHAKIHANKKLVLITNQPPCLT